MIDRGIAAAALIDQTGRGAARVATRAASDDTTTINLAEKELSYAFSGRDSSAIFAQLFSPLRRRAFQANINHRELEQYLNFYDFRLSS